MSSKITNILVLAIFMPNHVCWEDSQRGILFNFKRKILVAEKFYNAEFVLPFPDLNTTFGNHLKDVSETLNSFWTTQTNLCPLNFTLLNSTNLSIHWTYDQAKTEYDLAIKELQFLRNDTKELLSTSEDQTRVKRMGATAAFAAGAGLFGLGMGTGSGLGCALGGILGGCSESKSDENQDAIKKTVEYVNKMNKAWSAVQKGNNNRMFILATTMKKIKRQQDRYAKIQSANQQKIADEIAILRKNVHEFRTCTQFLYTRTSLNHNLISIQGILNVIHATLKVFRTALYVFESNILQNLSHMANGFLPMSILPKESLVEILEYIGTQQLRAADRLTLAIPLTKVLSYYETPLLRSVYANDVGLVFTLSVPMSSSSTVLNVFQPTVIPMPTEDNQAAVWDIESDYIAATEDKRFTALLSERQFHDCIGSKSYSVCRTGFAMEKARDSCLATLLFHDEFAAVQNCKVKTVKLPNRVTAENLGYGRWLITSARSDFKLTETFVNSTDPTTAVHHSGCHVCIFTLGCGKELEADGDLYIQADLASCKTAAAKRLNIQLAPSLSSLFQKLPPLPEMPNMEDIGKAQEHLLQEFQLQLSKHPKTDIKSETQLNKIAEPIVYKMSELNPGLSAKFSSLVDWRASIALGLCSFAVSQLLHFGFLFIYNRYLKVNRRFPFRLNVGEKRIKTKPLAGVSEEDYRYLRGHPEHDIHKYAIVVPITEIGLPSIQVEDNGGYTQPTFNHRDRIYPEVPPAPFETVVSMARI